MKARIRALLFLWSLAVPVAAIAESPPACDAQLASIKQEFQAWQDTHRLVWAPRADNDAVALVSVSQKYQDALARIKGLEADVQRLTPPAKPEG